MTFTQELIKRVKKQGPQYVLAGFFRHADSQDITVAFEHSGKYDGTEGTPVPSQHVETHRLSLPDGPRWIVRKNW